MLISCPHHEVALSRQEELVDAEHGGPTFDRYEHRAINNINKSPITILKQYMVGYPCLKCPLVARTPSELRRHLGKKNPCDVGNYSCGICKKKFVHASGLFEHKKNNRCPGHSSLTDQQKDEQIRNLQLTLEAVRGMGETIPDKTTVPINVNVNININTGDITNIQNNITVNTTGSENIDYIRAMSLEGFKQEIGLSPHYSTMSNLFKFLRINADHPENHNLLLPDRDGDMVHWKSKDGWKQTDYKEKIRSLLHNDIINVLDTKIKGRDRDDTFYWGFIVHEIMRKCGEIDHLGLKPIYDDIRDPLHEQTMKYVKEFREAVQETEQDDVGTTTGLINDSNVQEDDEEDDEVKLEDVQLMMSNMMDKLQIIEKKLAKKKRLSET